MDQAEPGWRRWLRTDVLLTLVGLGAGAGGALLGSKYLVARAAAIEAEAARRYQVREVVVASADVTRGGTLLTGGRFSLAGSVIGALIIQTLTYAIYSLGVPPEINLVVKAAVVFAVMLLQSAEFRASVRQLVQRAPAGGVSA